MPARIATLTAALILAAPLTAPAAALNARPGAWEITTTSTTAGNLVPAEALARMPPEQRAKLEATMRARAGKPTTSVSKSCVTQAELDQDKILAGENDDDCTRKIISRSPTKVVMDQTCTAPEASTSRITIEAPTPERIVATMDMTRGEDGKVGVVIKGRWLAASCAGVEDDE